MVNRRFFVVLFLALLTTIWASVMQAGFARELEISGMVIFVNAIPGLFAVVALLYAIWELNHIIQRHQIDELAENAKVQFVSFIAHQLKTPMSQISWMIEQIIDESKLSNNVKSDLLEVQKRVRVENRLINNLLNVSRIERGVLKVVYKEVYIQDLISQSLIPLKQIAKERGIEIQTEKYPKISVYVDFDKISEAIRNVIENAIKFSHKDSVVKIGFSDEKKYVVITVSDKGPGIPEELWDSLFKVKTYQDPHVVSEKTGAGLGLYLAGQFIKMSKGTIGFQTSSDGTTFYIRLPKHKLRSKL